MTDRIPSVLVLDPVQASCDAAATELARLVNTVWRASGIDGAGRILEAHSPDAIVSEVRLEDGTVVDLLELLRRRGSAIPVVVLTSRGSIALAVRLLQHGAADFLTKPATGEEILSRLGANRGVLEDELSEARTFTLHRAMWEYINRVIDEAGSIHGAARRLGLERRSLQRMLAKDPPPEHARLRSAASGVDRSRSSTQLVAVTPLNQQRRLRRLG